MLPLSPGYAERHGYECKLNGTLSLFAAFNTATGSSWLDRAENCFSAIQREVIARGIFTFVKDLDRKLMRYIREQSNDAAD